MSEQRLPDAKVLLLDLLDESYNRFAWHGPNLTQALRGVDATQANWRPSSAEAMPWNIAEIVRHVEDVMRHCGFSLLGRSGGPFLGEIQRTFPLPDLLDEVWTNVIGLLDESYNLLRQAVSETTLARLAEMSRGYERDWTFFNFVYGVAFHNVYHAAQIVSLRKRQGTWTEWQP